MYVVFSIRMGNSVTILKFPTKKLEAKLYIFLIFTKDETMIPDWLRTELYHLRPKSQATQELRALWSYEMCGYWLRQTADASSSPVTAGEANECWGSRIGKRRIETRAGIDKSLWPLLVSSTVTRALQKHYYCSQEPQQEHQAWPIISFLSHKPVRSTLVVYYTPYLYKIQRVLSTRPVGTVFFILSPIPSWQWT